MSNWLYRAYTVAGSGLVLLGLPPFFLYTPSLGGTAVTLRNASDVFRLG